MTWELGEAAMTVKGLSHSERMVLSRYCHRANRENISWPGLKSLVMETGIGRDWISKCRKSLEQKGYMTLLALGTGHKSSVYQCNRELIAANATLELSVGLNPTLHWTESNPALESVQPNLSVSIKESTIEEDTPVASQAGDTDSHENNGSIFGQDDDVRHLDSGDVDDGVSIAVENIVGDDDEKWHAINSLFQGRDKSGIQGNHVLAAARYVERGFIPAPRFSRQYTREELGVPPIVVPMTKRRRYAMDHPPNGVACNST